MDRVAELIQTVTTVHGRSLAPSFARARDTGDIDKSYSTIDCCVNDDCVYSNAPRRCDPTGARQNAQKHKCPICAESRYVLEGPEKGKARKQIIVFSFKETIRTLFAQPGFSKKINKRFGNPHPLTLDDDYEMQVVRFEKMDNILL